jgi:DNA-binding response OmpR family regulator
VIANEPSSSSALMRTVSSVPLILMGENTSQQQKLIGIRFGAVDFLEKPVAMLKLRNIWQHTVRKVCISTGSSRYVEDSGSVVDLACISPRFNRVCWSCRKV